MKLEPTALEGVVRVVPKVYEDGRGFFMESFRQDRFLAAGIGATFVQDNLSGSVGGTLRGLHFQLREPQAKLVQVLEGRIYDVAVDVRRGSPRFGQWVGAELSADNRHQLYVPEGFAHGFCVLSEFAQVAYKCTHVYDPDSERTVRWDDPALAVTWPIRAPLLSAKDAAARPLAELADADLPVYEG